MPMISRAERLQTYHTIRDTRKHTHTHLDKVRVLKESADQTAEERTEHDSGECGAAEEEQHPPPV